MDCQQAWNELGRQVDGELPAAERAALEAHLAECDGCRAACDTLRVDDADLLRAFMPRRRTAAALADRVIEQLHNDRRRYSRARSWAVPLVAAAAGFLLAVLVFRPPLGPRHAAAPQAEMPLARLALSTGTTEMRTPPGGVWMGCPPSGDIQAGAEVRTVNGARCEIEASDGTQIRLDVGTLIELPTPRCVKLTQGELYSSISGDGAQFKIEMPDVVVETAQGKFDASCSPGESSLTVIEGSASVECKSGIRRIGPGEQVRLVDGRAQDTVRVADPLQATAWINELLVLKGPDNPELAERLNDILAQVGQAKLSYLYEDEIRRLGSRAALPLLRYIASPRSQANPASRVSAARIASDLADTTVVGDLIALLSDGDPKVRFHVARALQRLTGTDQGRPAAAWQDDLLTCQPTLEAWQTWWRSRATTHERPAVNGDNQAAQPPQPDVLQKARRTPRK